MWYSRPVFNNYLKQLGVTEQSCTERQCMIALSATSDELRKYPIACEHVKRYAGPQCFPHLNPSSAEYRVLANEEKFEGGSASHTHADDIMEERNWLQCCRCSKWRYVSRGSAGAFGGAIFSACGLQI